MSRQRWIWDPVAEKVVEVGDRELPQSAGPMVSRDIKPYACPITGKVIDGRRDHRENLARTDSRVLERGEVEHDQRRRKEDSSANLDRILGI